MSHKVNSHLKESPGVLETLTVMQATGTRVIIRTVLGEAWMHHSDPDTWGSLRRPPLRYFQTLGKEKRGKGGLNDPSSV